MTHDGPCRQPVRCSRGECNLIKKHLHSEVQYHAVETERRKSRLTTNHTRTDTQTSRAALDLSSLTPDPAACGRKQASTTNTVTFWEGFSPLEFMHRRGGEG